MDTGLMGNMPHGAQIFWLQHYLVNEDCRRHSHVSVVCHCITTQATDSNLLLAITSPK